MVGHQTKRVKTRLEVTLLYWAEPATDFAAMLELEAQLVVMPRPWTEPSSQLERGRCTCCDHEVCLARRQGNLSAAYPKPTHNFKFEVMSSPRPVLNDSMVLSPWSMVQLRGPDQRSWALAERLDEMIATCTVKSREHAAMLAAKDTTESLSVTEESSNLHLATIQNFHSVHNRDT